MSGIMAMMVGSGPAAPPAPGATVSPTSASTGTVSAGASSPATSAAFTASGTGGSATAYGWVVVATTFNPSSPGSGTVELTAPTAQTTQVRVTGVAPYYGDGTGRQVFVTIRCDVTIDGVVYPSNTATYAVRWPIY